MKASHKILSFVLSIITLLGAFPMLTLSDVFAANNDPVVYLSMSEGDDSNNGSLNSPVATITAAFAKLAETGIGGTIVLMDGVNTRTSADSSILLLADAGGTVTITSNYGGVDYRSTNEARLMLYYGVAFQNDVIFDGIDFLHISPTANRAVYLQHNNLTITESCATFDYSGNNHGVGKCPAKNHDAPIAKGAGTFVIVTGYRTASSGTAINFGTQKITLNGARFGRIYVGNKKYNGTASAPTEQTRADSGNVWISVGENAGVAKFIDATTEKNNITTYVTLPSPDITVNFNDGVDPSLYVSINANDYFDNLGFSLKNTDLGPAIGVNESINAEFVDTTPICEFGYAFMLNDDCVFPTIGNVNAHRSYAYTAGETGYRNYSYEQDAYEAYYKGILIYDLEHAKYSFNTRIVAYPYAIDEATGYTYIGEGTSFTLSEICNMIINDPSASESDKQIAEIITNYALNYKIERFTADPVPEHSNASVVYVSESGHENGDGSSDTSTVTFETALGMTKNVAADTVVIVVTDAITLDPASTINSDMNDTGAASADFTYYFPANRSKVIITSYYGGVNYRQTNNASITLTSEIAFYGDYTIKNTQLINTADIKICMQYNDITLGTGLTCTIGEGATKNIELVAGYHADHAAYVSVESVSCREDAKIEVLDGTWHSFSGGNVTKRYRSVFGNVYEDATVSITIGTASKAPSFTSTDRYYFTVSGQNNVEGTVCVNIVNAKFSSNNPLLCSQYLMIYDEMFKNYHPTVNGHIVLNIQGGSFNTSTITAVPNEDQYNYVSKVGENAKFSINVLGGAFKSDTTSLSIKGNNKNNTELYIADTYSVSFLSSDYTKVDEAIALPTPSGATTSYDTPPTYDKVIEEGVYDLSDLTDAELEELRDALPPSDSAKAHLNTAINYYTATNKDKTDRANMLSLNDTAYNLVGVADVEFITMLSGEYSINKTFTNYNIGGSGGGYMIDCGDFVLVAFGDTEGDADNATDKNDPAYGGPWRANVLGFTYDDDYTDGILLDGFYLSDQGVYDGFASEFLLSNHKSGVEMS
ncbi:MAG: hypothetical protein II370_06035, partial [Clostridia bacterium]|nr:hypothetical protein [Clostridia bacterium]